MEDKKILRDLYISSISESAMPIFREKISMMEKEIESLVRRGMIKEDKTLTEKGRKSIKVVLTGGVFDIIHPGHINTLRAAKILGDVLIVVVANDKIVKKMKDKMPLHTMEQRRALVSSLTMVDCAIIGDEKDIFKTVEYVKPDIIALGYDQIHQEKFIIDGCKKIGVDTKVIRLKSPIPNMKSSQITSAYGKLIYMI